MSRLFPRNENLLMHHPPATPKNAFEGIEIAGVSNVSLIADHALGSLNDLKYAPTPLRKASVKTDGSGSNKKKSKKTSATPVSVHRTHAASCVAWRDFRPGREV